MNVLVIEDEEGMQNLIKMNLELENFEVLTAKEGREGIRIFKIHQPDMVILDLMLPDIEGFKVLEELQKINYRIPVIVLTAKNSQNDKLLGLELGADDYITKPFNNRELILRMRVILKRMKKASSLEKKSVIECGPVKIIKDSYELLLRGNEVHLSRKEFEVMSFLMERCGRVVSRNALLERVWGFDDLVDTRAVDITIQRIRKKFGKDANFVKTIYGVGYKVGLEDET